MCDPKCEWRTYLQETPRPDIRVSSLPLGLLEVGENMQTALVIALADFRGVDAACGSVQQPDPNSLFESLNVLAHHCGGHAEMARRCDEAAALHHLDENSHAAEAIHTPSFDLADDPRTSSRGDEN